MSGDDGRAEGCRTPTRWSLRQDVPPGRVSQPPERQQGESNGRTPDRPRQRRPAGWAMNGANVRGWTVADQLVAGEPAQVTVQLGWRESDPYAVELLFVVGEDGCEDVPWLVARD